MEWDKLGGLVYMATEGGSDSENGFTADIWARPLQCRYRLSMYWNLEQFVRVLSESRLSLSSWL